MLKTIIGFVLGVLTTYYALPVLEDYFGKLPRPVLSSPKEVNHSSNTINSVPPSPQKTSNAGDDFGGEIITAITLTKSRSPEAKASDFALKLISKLIDDEPEIRPYVKKKLPDGLTNREALEIFEQYYFFKE
jgi:hypothetical protein